jgi:hypothetical protein
MSGAFRLLEGVCICPSRKRSDLFVLSVAYLTRVGQEVMPRNCKIYSAPVTSLCDLDQFEVMKKSGDRTCT